MEFLRFIFFDVKKMDCAYICQIWSWKIKKIPNTYQPIVTNKVEINLSFYTPQKCMGVVVLQLFSFLTSALCGSNDQLDTPSLPNREERDHSTHWTESLMGAGVRPYTSE
jgi:hypothetical protein